MSEIPLKENFVLQPGILYSAKGSKYSVGEEDMTISPGFIEIPVNALYKFDVSSAKLFVLAGPYFAFGIGGNIETSEGSADIQFGSGDTKTMKAFDLGLNIGAGVEIKNFQFKVQYGLGLTNLAPVTENDAEMKVRTIGLTVAYLFGGK
ncbi:MAG: porin family protein [Bacteroidales bacterium]|nr:porin family protein [Bacteroidales bacterium]